MSRDARLLIQVAISALVLYSLLGLFVAPDLEKYAFQWLLHIRAEGPAFAQPFSNYTPPYLYLLAVLSPLPDLVAVKLIAVGGSIWLAFAVWRLLIALGCEKHTEAAVLTLLLPTALINGPLLGQCDALWVAPCILAVAAGAEGRTYKMAVWAGIGFAFKAQAAFIAPFALALLVQERKWPAILVPPAVYFAAILPAWLAGWPLGDLFTIYARQYDYLSWLSTAPNFWAPISILDHSPPSFLFAIGYALTLAAMAVYFALFSRNNLLLLALLSAMLLPWIMPKMHERYFLLADVLAFCVAYSRGDRRGFLIFAGVQAGSLLSLFAYLVNFEPLNVVGAVPMTLALLAVVRLLNSDRRGPPVIDHDYPSPHRTNESDEQGLPGALRSRR